MSVSPWHRRLVLIVYNLLLPVVVLLMMPASLLKMRKRGGYGKKFWQRFGIFSTEDRLPLISVTRPYWLHAVSVGEVNVALKLIAQLQTQDPQRPLVLSTTTSTGMALAEKEVPPGVSVIYSPVDFIWVVRKVLQLINPIKIVLVEAEVWPNLAHQATRSAIPVLLVNARLSPRSEQRYHLFKWLVTPIFGMLQRVLVQFPEDIRRWESLGVPQSRIFLTGSVKYDDPPSKPKRVEEFRQILHQLWDSPTPPLILAASTFRGEELAIMQCAKRLRKNAPNLRVILVPRHFERATDLQKELAQAGFLSVLKTDLTPPPHTTKPDALIVNTTGELRDWQHLPTVVVIGKSFLEKGGQNPAEAIAAGTPVITGPHMENFASLMRHLWSEDGIVTVPNVESLDSAIETIMRQPESARKRVAHGQTVLRQHLGAAVRTSQHVIQFPEVLELPIF